MMNKTEVFSVLQIEPTNDQTIIKKAYVELTKKYHPEEYPDEWQKIHAAYEQALSYAQQTIQQPLLDESQWNQVFTPYYNSYENSMSAPVGKEEPETAEMDEVFGDIEQLATAQMEEMQKQEEEKFKMAVSRLRALDKSKDLGQWHRLFEDTDISILSRGEFLYRWGDMITEMNITPGMKDLFYRQMDEIRAYCSQNQVKHARTRTLGPIEFMLKTLREKQTKSIAVGKGTGWIIGAMAAVFTLRMVGEKMEAAVEKEQERQQVVIDSIEKIVDQDFSDDSEMYTATSLYEESVEVLQTKLASLQQEALSDETAVQSMIENAAVLRDGVFLLKSSSDFKKNESEYRYDVITDCDEISALTGLAVEDDQFYAVRLWTDSATHAAAFTFKPEQLGLEKECIVFGTVGDTLEEIPEWDYEATQAQTNCVYEFAGYKSVALHIPQGDTDSGIYVILVNKSVQATE